MAAAIFGSPDHLRFEPATTAPAFIASDADVAFDELTWTFNREQNSGLAQGPVYFFDGQALLAHDAAGLTSAAQMPDATVCVEQGAPFLDNLIAFLQDHAPNMTIAVAGKRADEEAAFFSGACDLLTGDASEIYSAARAHGGGPYVILSDRLSKEPLVPVVRQGDERLLAIVRWTIFATMEAEELGVTAESVDADASFGVSADPMASAKLGLPPDWPRKVIKAVGNYGEFYDRSLGPSGNVKMARGLNQLWTSGGLLYSPPLR
jgi:general L-amino acid transport system substrate-binding protein